MNTSVGMDDLIHEIGVLHMQTTIQQRQVNELMQQNASLRQQLQSTAVTNQGKPEGEHATS